MASFRKRGETWTASVRLRGQSRTATFRVKAQAVAWAASIEADIIAGKSGAIPDKTFAQLLMRYAEEVSPTKRGTKWELTRINLICRDPVARFKLTQLTQAELAAWRDARLRVVSAASVQREMNLISHALSVATTEWKWLPANPMKGVRRPPATPPRDTRPTDEQIERLLFALGYARDAVPATITARVGAAMLFAIETAMRVGELCAMRRVDVDLDNRFVHIPITKNGHKRDVALSTEAVRIVRQLPDDGELVFNLSTSQVDALFRKAKGKALVGDLHFHDMRHEAITRLAKKLNVLELARMVGHRNLKQLQVYYNESAAEIAKKLD